MKVDEGFWLAHVAAIRSEGVSASAYARRQGLSVAALYYWQRKFKTAEATGSTGIGKFIALRVGDATPPIPTACTLVLSSGVRLEMSMLPPPEWLAAFGSCAMGGR